MADVLDRVALTIEDWDTGFEIISEAWKEVSQCVMVFNITTSIYKCTTDTSGVLIGNPRQPSFGFWFSAL